MVGRESWGHGFESLPSVFSLIFPPLARASPFYPTFPRADSTGSKGGFISGLTAVFFKTARFDRFTADLIACRSFTWTEPARALVPVFSGLPAGPVQS